jgi:hypothetical protein
VLFYCFQVLNKHAINSIDFGLQAHFEKDLEDVVKLNQIKEMIKSEFLQ